MTFFDIIETFGNDIESIQLKKCKEQSNSLKVEIKRTDTNGKETTISENIPKGYGENILKRTIIEILEMLTNYKADAYGRPKISKSIFRFI